MVDALFNRDNDCDGLLMQMSLLKTQLPAFCDTCDFYVSLLQNSYEELDATVQTNLMAFCFVSFLAVLPTL